MKPTSLFAVRAASLFHAATIVCFSVAFSSPGRAADGTWTGTANANWSNTGSWAGGTVADGAGSTANITAAIGGTRTITLDTARTIGTLNIGDTDRTHSYVISGGQVLSFNNAGAAAAIIAGATSNNDSISTAISLTSTENANFNIVNNNAVATTSTARTLTISGAISSGDATLAKVINVTGVSNVANVAISGAISNGLGTVSLTKSTGNILTLSGNNSFTGGVSLSAGTLYINSATALGTGTFTITGGSIGTTVAGGTTLTSNNAQAWDATFSLIGSNNLNMGAGAVTIAANRTITISGTLASSGAGPIFTVGGAIGETGGARTLTIQNQGNGNGISGTLVLSGANTYTGGTNINGGLVEFANTNAIPASGLVNIQSRGAVQLSGAFTTFADVLSNPRISTASAGAIALTESSSADFTAGSFNTLSLGAALGRTIEYTGTITPGTSGYYVGGGGGTMEFTNANTFTGANNLTIGNGGGGTVILSTGHNHSGLTQVAQGTTLILENAGALGATGVGSGTQVAAGGGIVLENVKVLNESLTIGGTSSTASPTNVPAGLLSNSGDNEWSGAITANLTTTGNNVRLNLTGGNLLISGTVNITNNSTTSVGEALVLTGNGTGTAEISGAISGTVAQALIKNGSSEWTLSGANTFTGGVRIDGGRLRAETLNSVTGGTASSSLGAPTNATRGTISLGEGASTGTLVYTGDGETTDRGIILRSTSTGATGGGIVEHSGEGILKFTGNVTSATPSSGSSSKTFTLQGSTSGTGEIAGVISNGVNGTIVSTTSVAKAGTGAWTLSGNNIYTGSTTVTGGLLTVTGGTDPARGINSTTSLSVTNGTFALGASDVVNNAATVTLGAGSVLQTAGFSEALGVLAVTGNAQLNLAGGDSVITFLDSKSASWTGGTLAISGWSGAAGGNGAEQVSFAATGLTVAQLGAVTFVNPLGFDAGVYSAKFVGNEIVPDALIPEPSSAVMLLAGSAGLIVRRRRKA